MDQTMWFKPQPLHASIVAAILVGSAAFSTYPAWGASQGILVSDSHPVTIEQLAHADELNRDALRLHRAGKFADARPLAKEALTLREAALGPTDPLIAESLNTLGIILQESDYKAARPLLERALKIRQGAFPPVHSAIAESLTNLSRTLYAGGQFAEARPLLEHAVHIPGNGPQPHCTRGRSEPHSPFDCREPTWRPSAISLFDGTSVVHSGSFGT
jgi:tetratricopeptide (TPR) repeat protein